MVSKRKRFSRPLGERPYKKLFVIAVEGKKTEVQYFDMFNRLDDSQSFIHVECLNSNHKSSPLQVLKRMLEYIKEKSLRKSDEALGVPQFIN